MKKIELAENELQTLILIIDAWFIIAREAPLKNKDMEAAAERRIELLRAKINHARMWCENVEISPKIPKKV